MWVILLDLAIIVIWAALTYSQQPPSSSDSRWSYFQRR